MLDDLQKWLESLGISSFDDLRPDEKDSYFKLLELAESSKITLEDITKHIHEMRMGVEYSLASDKLNSKEDLFLKARLKNYILLEALFDRPERAKQMLKQQTKIRKTGGEV